MIHAVKCLPDYFKALKDGSKTFEVRKKDRPYRVGDFLAVNEFIPESIDPYDDFMEMQPPDAQKADGGLYTGENLIFKITYILSDKEFCREGMVILGIAKCALALK